MGITLVSYAAQPDLPATWFEIPQQHISVGHAREATLFIKIYSIQLFDMLSVDQTIQSSREIKILLLPIGNISDNKFEEYYNLLKSIKVIELETVTRDLSSKCKCKQANIN